MKDKRAKVGNKNFVKNIAKNLPNFSTNTKFAHATGLVITWLECKIEHGRNAIRLLFSKQSEHGRKHKGQHRINRGRISKLG